MHEGQVSERSSRFLAVESGLVTTSFRSVARRWQAGQRRRRRWRLSSSLRLWVSRLSRSPGAFAMIAPARRARSSSRSRRCECDLHVCAPRRWKVSALRKSSGRALILREGQTQWGRSAAKIRKKTSKSRWQQFASHLTASNAFLLLLWACFIALMVQINAIAADRATFEPYSILGVSESASDAEIRKAYRDLSRKYHPDKNPDPKAHKFFSEKVAKAYEALIDEQGKENFKKYGHPDGKRSLDIGVALPSFFFDTDSRMQTFLLFLIIGVGVLLPLFLAVRYLLHSGKYSQGIVLKNTNSVFAYLLSDQMKLDRVLEALIRAEEFIGRKMTSGERSKLQDVCKRHGVSHGELYQAQSSNRTTKQQQAQQQAQTGPGAELVRTRAIMHVQLQQEVSRLPNELWDSYVDAMEKAPNLLATLTEFAFRPPREKADKHNMGFLQPAMNSIHLSACLAHGVPLANKNLDALPSKLKKEQNSKARKWPSLMQAPHMHEQLVRDLIVKHQIYTVWDLVRMDPEERTQALRAHITEEAKQDIEAFMRELPFVAMKANIETEGSEKIQVGDVITCTVSLACARCKPSSSRSGSKRSHKLTQLPMLPCQRGERWYVVLADRNSQRVLAAESVSMPELPYDSMVKNAIAEGDGAAMKVSHKSSKGEHGGATGASENGTVGDAKANGVSDCRNGDETAETSSENGLVLEELRSAHQFTLRTKLPEAGTYYLDVHVLSDMWVDCDVFESITKDVEGQREPKAVRKKKLTGKERRQMKKEGQNPNALQTLSDENRDAEQDEEMAETPNDDEEDEEDLEDGDGTEESDEGKESDADFLLEPHAEDEYVGIG